MKIQQLLSSRSVVPTKRGRMAAVPSTGGVRQGAPPSPMPSSFPACRVSVHLPTVPTSSCASQSYVRGHAAIGKQADSCTSMFPAQKLQPLRNPIHVWDTALNWHKAFGESRPPSAGYGRPTPRYSPSAVGITRKHVFPQRTAGSVSAWGGAHLALLPQASVPRADRVQSAPPLRSSGFGGHCAYGRGGGPETWVPPSPHKESPPCQAKSVPFRKQWPELSRVYGQSLAVTSAQSPSMRGERRPGDTRRYGNPVRALWCLVLCGG